MNRADVCMELLRMFCPNCKTVYQIRMTPSGMESVRDAELQRIEDHKKLADELAKISETLERNSKEKTDKMKVYFIIRRTVSQVIKTNFKTHYLIVHHYQ